MSLNCLNSLKKHSNLYHYITFTQKNVAQYNFFHFNINIII